MKNDKRMLLIVEEQLIESYRVKRIFEEAEKRLIEVIMMCSNQCDIFGGDVFISGKRVEIENFDIVYSLGNPPYHQYIMAIITSKNPKAVLWPDANYILMSDKFIQNIFLESNNIPTPKTILLNNKNLEEIDRKVNLVGGYPCVIKKVTGATGIFVGLCHSSAEVIDFIKNFPQISITGKKNIILQEYIAESKGEDHRVYCVDGKAIGMIKRKSSSDDFRANISLGGSAESVELPVDVAEMAEKIVREGKMKIAGVDFIKSEKGFKVLEINLSADFQGFEKTTGINVTGKIIDMFRNELKDLK